MEQWGKSMSSRMYDPKDIKALADEIDRRKIKFADLVHGKYEMPSDQELEWITTGLRLYAQHHEGKVNGN